MANGANSSVGGAATTPLNTVQLELELHEAIDVVRHRISSEHGAKALVGILGSESFNEETEYILRALTKSCVELGRKVAFITNGMEGVQRQFTENCGTGEQCYDLRPEGSVQKYSQGNFVHAGRTASDRDIIFTTIGQAYLIIEGGPHTAELAKAAKRQGGFLIPLARTGGASRGMYGLDFEKPNVVRAERWLKLWEKDMHVTEYAETVTLMLNNIYYRQKERDGGNKLYSNFLRRQVEYDVKRNAEHEPAPQDHLESWTANYFQRRLVEGRRHGLGDGGQHKDSSGYRHKTQKTKEEELVDDAEKLRQRAADLKRVGATGDAVPHDMRLAEIENELTRIDARRIMLLSELRGRGAAHNVDEVFKMMDTSHDGKIDREEFGNMLRTLNAS